jgi:hypothetical protein
VQALAGGVNWLELVDGTALDSGERRQDGAWDDVLPRCRFTGLAGLSRRQATARLSPPKPSLWSASM